eukprot:TRINITY_DN20143_c0_g1_i1.p1 TRINITY_DN20143_c0_g1~~TRINITY_DN20143_c0_g1_i1.p1  ORF type:complete len:1155 (-),score=356.77 TRINITY_DN20143_c0_g1_i1:177-3554(-)
MVQSRVLRTQLQAIFAIALLFGHGAVAMRAGSVGRASTGLKANMTMTEAAAENVAAQQQGPGVFENLIMGVENANIWPFSNHKRERDEAAKVVINKVKNNYNGLYNNLHKVNKIGQQTGQNLQGLAAQQNAIAGVQNQVAGLGNGIAQNAQGIAHINNAIGNNAGNLAAQGQAINQAAAQAAANAQQAAMQGQAANALGQHAAQNAGRIAQNANLANAVNGRVNANLAGLGQNHQTVNVLGQKIGQQAQAIGQNAQAANQLANQAAQQANAIANQANNLAHLGNAAAQNANGVANNLQAANALNGHIAATAEQIAAQSQALSGLGNQLHNVEGAIAQNAGAIAGQQNAIAAVGGELAANANALQDVANLAGNNAAAIAQNSNAIGQAAQNAAANSAALGEIAGNLAGNQAALNAVESQIANNANVIANVATQAAQNAMDAATNAAGIANAGQHIAANSHNIAAIASSVGMLSGSVAANSAQIATLTAEVAVLQEVAGPTLALAEALGLNAGTVAQLSLAGSFVGPLMGVILLVYVSWPEAEKDNWWKMEARVSRMLTARFDHEKRTKLSNKLKRYIEEFAHCAHAWAKYAMPPKEVNEGSALLQHHLTHASKGELRLHEPKLDHTEGEDMHKGDDDVVPEAPDNKTTVVLNKQCPRCLSQLEGHMALERDEWMFNQGNSLTGLFMPFANMHTQLLAALSDWHDKSDHMQWNTLMKQRSAEYALYMLKQITKAWKAQVCRTVRLRHSAKLTEFGWKYQFVALAPKWQPNAGDTCMEQCGGKAGWCNFCGGVGVGACCKLGSEKDAENAPECAAFDIPSNRVLANHHICVHTDCFQDNSYYSGTDQVGETNYDPKTPDECQAYCHAMGPGKAAVFNFKKEWFSYGCSCYEGGEGLYRINHEEGISGPTVCPKEEALPTQTKEMKDHMPHIPMKQVAECVKSAAMSNVEDLEEKDPDWVKTCLMKATETTIKDFNPFYQRFAKFVERLEWMSGCGDLEHDGGVQGYEEENWEAISGDGDVGSFSECKWEKDEDGNELPEDQVKPGEWTGDDLEFAQGITGTSRINLEEQSKMKVKFPVPAWLARLRNQKECLKNAAADGVGKRDSRSSIQNMILTGFAAGQEEGSTEM